MNSLKLLRDSLVTMGDYRRLIVWQKAYALSLQVYRSTRPFPNVERYGLSSQLRRAAVSVVANIAEGAGRGSDCDFSRFLWMARGSLVELCAELSLSLDLGYLAQDEASELLDASNEVGRLLTGLLKAKGAIPKQDRPTRH